MPYTIVQLEFLKVHMGVAVPPQFLEKKSAAENEAVDGIEKEGEELDAEASPEPQKPAERWKSVKAKIVTQLQAEIKSIVATQDPDAGSAELELRAVLAQLGGAMESQKQANELLSYLAGDEVVANVCDLAFDLKTPLLKVLKEIQPQLAA
ncbi:MAG TPA: hypothetical protein VK961_22810 [Chthoniobacter sp.]|nr:hypothetical protein [Chthoniobacter sp.]